jgi:type III restriction enzyme
MGGGSGPKSPMLVEVDRENTSKNIDRLDIDLPQLAPRILREYKNLSGLDPSALPHKRVPVKAFTDEQQREIVFRDMNTDEQSHVTAMDTVFTPNYQNMIGFFTRTVMRDLRLVGGFDVLFGKIKQFVETELFERPVDLEDLNTLRNLSEIEATRTLMETIKAGVNALTVLDAGTTEVRGSIRIGKTRPFLVKEQAYITPKKSVFNKIVGDSVFELEMAAFLDGCDDIVSFVKNAQSTNFRIEYPNADGGIANYYPDFIVKRTESDIWIVETKGREDLDDPLKWERLRQWCEDATVHDGAKRSFHALFVRQEDWEAHKLTSFRQLVTACG